MKKAVVIFLALYYSFAIVVFPMCDFSMVQDLPKMYQHCKETEDANLTVLEFFTDHLIDFDEIFEGSHQNNREKPHQSSTHLSNNFVVQLVTPQQTLFSKSSPSYTNISQKLYCNYSVHYSYNYSNAIFHPPIA